MAQVLLGGFSWKFRAITSLTDELNSSCSISQGGKVKGSWLLREVVFFVVVVGFCCGFLGFFLRFSQVSVFILQDKEMDCKDLPIAWMSLCFGELLCLMESGRRVRMPS